MTIDVRSPEYRAWANMKTRCQNPRHPQYAYYGGRDIHVCARWQKFTAFRADMGLRPSTKHSLDRIDNTKGYSPSNCRWATRREQMNNTRCSKLVTFNGQTFSQAEWARQKGVTKSSLWRRLKNGVSVARALDPTSLREHRIRFQGKNWTLTEWARHLGMSKQVLDSRLRVSRWSVKKALTTPLKRYHREPRT